jgi:hypothetical protein
MILDLKGVLALFFPANDVNGFSSHDMLDNQSYINIACFIMMTSQRKTGIGGRGRPGTRAGTGAQRAKAPRRQEET